MRCGSPEAMCLKSYETAWSCLGILRNAMELWNCRSLPFDEGGVVVEVPARFTEADWSGNNEDDLGSGCRWTRYVGQDKDPAVSLSPTVMVNLAESAAQCTGAAEGF